MAVQRSDEIANYPRFFGFPWQDVKFAIALRLDMPAGPVEARLHGGAPHTLNQAALRVELP